MKRILKFLFFFILFSGGIFYLIFWIFTPKPSYFETYTGAQSYKKLNKNEENFRDSLLGIGYDSIEIYKPIIGLHGPYGSNIYNVFLTTRRAEFANKNDSIKIICKQIANQLYSKVISDMFIYDMESIYIYNNFCNQEFRKCHEKHFIFEKDSLEKWNGFKVIKIEEKKFKRVAYQIR